MSHPYKKRSRRGRSYSGHTYRSREYRLRQYRKRRIRRRLLFSLCLLTLLLVGGHIISIYASRGHTKPGRTEPDKQTGQTNVPGQDGNPAKLPDSADDALAKNDGTGSGGNSQTPQTSHTGSGDTDSSSNSSDSGGTKADSTDSSDNQNGSTGSGGTGSNGADGSGNPNGSTDGSGKNGSGTADGSADTGEDEDSDPSEMNWTPGGDEPETEGAGSSAEEDEFNFENALFIGDSRTEGLFINTGLTEATFYAVRGLNVENIYTKSFIKDKTILAAKEKEEGSKKKSKKKAKKKKDEDEEEEENGVTIMEALKYHSWRKIYIMLGVNELGWAYESIFIDRYTDLIRDIRELQPEAEIVIQSILPVTKEKSDNDEIYNNKRISRYNKLIQAMAKEEDVTWADLTPAVSGKNGALPKKGSSDGVHLTKSYYIKWLDYLIEHEI